MDITKEKERRNRGLTKKKVGKRQQNEKNENKRGENQAEKQTKD